MMIVRWLSIPLLLLLLHVGQAIGHNPLFVNVGLNVSGEGTKVYIDHQLRMSRVRLCLSEDGEECWGIEGRDPVIGMFSMTRRPWLEHITAEEFAEHGWSMSFNNLKRWKKDGKKYLLVNKGYFDSTRSFELTNSSLFTGTAGPYTFHVFGLTVQVNISCLPGHHGESCERACEKATGMHVCDEHENRFLGCRWRCEHRYTGICVPGPPDYCGFDSGMIRDFIDDYPNRTYGVYDEGGSAANVPSPLPDHVRKLMDETLAKYPLDAPIAKGDWNAFSSLPWPTAAPADTVDATSTSSDTVQASVDGAK